MNRFPHWVSLPSSSYTSFNPHCPPNVSHTTYIPINCLLHLPCLLSGDTVLTNLRSSEIHVVWLGPLHPSVVLRLGNVLHTPFNRLLPPNILLPSPQKEPRAEGQGWLPFLRLASFHSSTLDLEYTLRPAIEISQVHTRASSPRCACCLVSEPPSSNINHLDQPTSVSQVGRGIPPPPTLLPRRLIS